MMTRSTPPDARPDPSPGSGRMKSGPIVADPQSGERNQTGERGLPDGQGTLDADVTLQDSRLGQRAARKGGAAAAESDSGP